MNFFIIKNINSTTYLFNSCLSVCILNNNKLFYIYYKIEENFFAKSYFLKEEFLKNNIHCIDIHINYNNSYISNFLKINPEIINQIKKIIKYSFI